MSLRLFYRTAYLDFNLLCDVIEGVAVASGLLPRRRYQLVGLGSASQRNPFTFCFVSEAASATTAPKSALKLFRNFSKKSQIISSLEGRSIDGSLGDYQRILKNPYIWKKNEMPRYFRRSRPIFIEIPPTYFHCLSTWNCQFQRKGSWRTSWSQNPTGSSAGLSTGPVNPTNKILISEQGPEINPKNHDRIQ